jgi:heme-degrading monooxygenase HmoA
MHIQVTNFNLKGMKAEEYERTCEQLANNFANIEGLVKKYWLKNIADNLYGGIYIWADKSYMEAFSQTELFKTIANHPGLDNITSADFGILEHPTIVTRGFIFKDYLESQSK